MQVLQQIKSLKNITHKKERKIDINDQFLGLKLYILKCLLNQSTNILKSITTLINFKIQETKQFIQSCYEIFKSY